MSAVVAVPVPVPVPVPEEADPGSSLLDFR
jgi:hypothetical protein